MTAETSGSAWVVPERLDELAVHSVRRWHVLAQLRLRDTDGHRVTLEFRPSQRSFAHAVVVAIGRAAAP